MIQIVIWGICIMLVVKAIEMMQRQTLAKNPTGGAAGYTTAGTVIAIIGALALFALSSGQASQMPSAPTIGGN